MRGKCIKIAPDVKLSVAASAERIAMNKSKGNNSNFDLKHSLVKHWMTKCEAAKSAKDVVVYVFF